MPENEMPVHGGFCWTEIATEISIQISSAGLSSVERRNPCDPIYPNRCLNSRNM